MRSHQKILDATLALIASGGFGAVSIAAVAQAAGVTRQTVYSNFGTREDLVSQAIATLAMEVLGDIRARLDTTDTPFDYIAELIVAGRAAVREHAVLATLLKADGGNPIFDEGMAERAVPVVRELLSPLVEREPWLGEHVDGLAAISLRLALSVVLFDDPTVHTDEALRAFLTRWLEPAIPRQT